MIEESPELAVKSLRRLKFSYNGVPVAGTLGPAAFPRGPMVVNADIFDIPMRERNLDMASCDSPPVTIILPTFNRAATIRRAIDSVLTQSYTDYELLVIDNGSRDSTFSTVAAYEDERVFYHVCERKRGPGAARNHGLALARGRYIAFIDSDDEWLPGKLHRQVRILDTSDDWTGLVYADMWWVSRRGTKVYHKSPRVTQGRLLDSERRFYQAYNIGIQTVLAKRHCLDAVGLFREDLPCFEDMEFLIRFSKRYRCHHVQRPLVNYFESLSGVSKQRNNEIYVRSRLLTIFRKELLRSISFYCRELVITRLCRYFDLSDYFYKGNEGCRHSLYQWIKRPASPYVRRFKRGWIRVVDRYLGRQLRGLSTNRTNPVPPPSSDAVVVLAPANENRMRKAFELFDASIAREILVFENGRLRTFGDRARFAYRRRVVVLLKSGTLSFVSHGTNARPSTFSEAQILRDSLRSRYRRMIIVTDEFHVARTQLVVDRLFEDAADEPSVLPAPAPGAQHEDWWHTLSGIRVHTLEALKLIYYRYWLLGVLAARAVAPHRDRKPAIGNENPIRNPDS